jgi:NTE family protein
MITGGRAGAKDNLDWLWAQVGAVEDLRLTHWMQAVLPGTGFLASAIQSSMPFNAADSLSRVFSPYSYGPFYRNPLARVVERFDFGRVCARTGPALFISATNVRTGKIRVFEYEEISTDVILASACLPTLFQAVEIDDPRTGQIEAFWDGGYTGNPALFPLFDPGLPDDIVIVNINPLYRPDVPLSAPEILNRINEISFNSSLLRELRAIRFVKELIAEGKVAKGAMKDVLVHMVADDGLMRELSVATKLIPTPLILDRLKAAGRAAAERFLETDAAMIGRTATVDLEEMFG